MSRAFPWFHLVPPLLFGACAAALPPARNPEVPGEDAGVDVIADGDWDADVDVDANDDAADAAVLTDAGQAALSGPCPPEMALVNGAFCMDRYEGSLVEITDAGETPFPHWISPDEHTVRAVSAPSVPPQGYISAVSAGEACAAAGKRLCSLVEWKRACMGAAGATFPYGSARKPGQCNDNGRSPVGVVFPQLVLASKMPAAKSGAAAKSATPKVSAKTAKKKSKAKTKRTSLTKKKKHIVVPKGVDLTVWTKLNDPELGKVSGTWTLTGERAQCRSEDGIFDLVGNRHEWVADETSGGNGIFAGGYFLDTSQNGEGCNYRTEAHAPSYHDYSTGFRCCADVAK